MIDTKQVFGFIVRLFALWLFYLAVLFFVHATVVSTYGDMGRSDPLWYGMLGSSYVLLGCIAIRYVRGIVDVSIGAGNNRQIWPLAEDGLLLQALLPVLVRVGGLLMLEKGIAPLLAFGRLLAGHDVNYPPGWCLIRPPLVILIGVVVIRKADLIGRLPYLAQRLKATEEDQA